MKYLLLLLIFAGCEVKPKDEVIGKVDTIYSKPMWFFGTLEDAIVGSDNSGGGGCSSFNYKFYQVDRVIYLVMEEFDKIKLLEFVRDNKDFIEEYRLLYEDKCLLVMLYDSADRRGLQGSFTHAMCTP